MLKVYEDGTIELTRGDTARLTVTITNDVDSREYQLESGDTLTFSVKKFLNAPKPCLQKVLNGTNTFHIEPADTAHFEFGKYKYDVQLRTASGDVYTVIEPTTIEFKPEVTC